MQVTIVYTALEQRRTVRHYQDRPVEEEKLRRIIQAVTLAPSAHHSTPWHLTVITDRSAGLRLAETMAAAWDRDMAADGVPAADRQRRVQRSVGRLSGAPALIVASLNTANLPAGDGYQARGEETMMTQSVACAVFALLLAASYEGLGAAWHCPPLWCPDDVRSLLGLPAHVRPQALVTLGYALSEPGPRPVRAIDDAVTWIR